MEKVNERMLDIILDTFDVKFIENEPEVTEDLIQTLVDNMREKLEYIKQREKYISDLEYEVQTYRKINLLRAAIAAEDEVFNDEDL